MVEVWKMMLFRDLIFRAVSVEKTDGKAFYQHRNLVVR